MKDISEVMLDRIIKQAEKIVEQQALIKNLELRVESTPPVWTDKNQWAQSIYDEFADDAWSHPDDIIKQYVDKLKAQVDDQRKSLDEIRNDDVAEYKRWKWAVDLRSESDNQKAGAHLTDWMKAHVDSLTAENDKLQQQLAVVQEREATRDHPPIDETQAQTANAITDAQSVQMIAQDLEAHAEELGLVATGETNEQGQMLYCSKEEAEQHAQASGAETEVESKWTALDVLKRDIDINTGGYRIRLGKNKMPVAESCKVEVYLRNRTTRIIGLASEFEWEQTESPDYVIAYRVHPNAETSAEAKSLPEIPEGFIRHDGGECPIPQTAKAIFLFRDGYKTHPFYAHEVVWQHDGDTDDIIAYKIIEE